MAQTAYPAWDTQPEVRHHLVRMLGTGASAPTKQIGDGITITRSGAGVYKLTWSENPGTFVGITYGLQAATPGDIAGHTVIADTYDSSTFSIEVVLYNSLFAAHDLAANEYILLDVTFKMTSL